MSDSGFAVTDGLILARREISDDVVRLDCYTERFGRVTGFLRKARWEKVFAAAPGSVGELTIRDPRLAASPLISGFERTSVFYREGMESPAYAALLAVLEALYRLLPQREPDRRLYGVAVASLGAIARGGSPVPVAVSFLLSLQTACGYRWRLDRCGGCGREQGEEFVLLPADGCLLCLSCRSQGERGVVLSNAAIVALRRLEQLPPERAARVFLHPTVAGEVLRAISYGIPCHFDRSLHSLALLA